jgi:hypothetical protein
MSIVMKNKQQEQEELSKKDDEWLSAQATHLNECLEAAQRDDKHRAEEEKRIEAAMKANLGLGRKTAKQFRQG